MKRALLGAVVVIAGIVVWVLNNPYQGFRNETFVDIPHGTGTRGMADLLARAGVIQSSWQFLIARALHPTARLQAGEYRFSRAASVREVFNRIARGDVYYFDFTVPEGSNIFDIARSLDSQNILSESAFLQAAADPSPIRDLSPKAHTLEGFLFPSTYRLTHSTTAIQLTKIMTDEFRNHWNRLPNRGSADITQAVTLASIIEKETAVPAERPLVASVYLNRLAIGMRLECDPTTIYAALLDNRYGGVIHRSDLSSANPYNTYQHAGLPPGPITNPGMASLEAALAPAQTKYLYFVAKPAGGEHQFSTTMADHEKAVVAYRHFTQKKASRARTLAH